MKHGIKISNQQTYLTLAQPTTTIVLFICLHGICTKFGVHNLTWPFYEVNKSIHSVL